MRSPEDETRGAVVVELGRPKEAPDAGPADKASRTIEIFSAADFADREAPARRWHVPELIPGSNVTLLGGDGGVGKSLLALQLAVSTTAGVNWCGLSVAPGPVLVIAAEDDQDELHRRIAAIALRMNLDLADLKRLHLVPLAGEDAILAAPDKAGLAMTPLFTAVEAAIVQHCPALIICDTLSDLFGGNENSRTESRQFVSLLRGWALRYRAAVLLLAHPSLSGMSSGSGLSGSTAWNASVRSRLYLDRCKDDGGFEPDPNVRLLKTLKANYAATGTEVRLRWVDGFLETLDNAAVTSTFGVLAAQDRIDRKLLELIEAFTKEGRRVSPHPTSNSYGPTMIARDPRAEGITRKAFESALGRLFATGQVQVIKSPGPPSKQYDILAVTPQWREE